MSKIGAGRRAGPKEMSMVQDHREIEERDVVGLYLRHELSEEETARFEEHLLECTECFEQVKWDDAIGRSMREVAAAEAVQLATTAGLWAWLRRSPRGRFTGWLLSVLVAAGLPSALYLHQRSDVARLTAPQINTPIFTLGAVRDADATGRVTLGSTPEWIVLSLELPAVGHGTYRAILLRGEAVVWQAEGLVPNAGDALVVSIHSPLLGPGDYRLRLEGLPGAVPAGEFPFRVVREP